MKIVEHFRTQELFALKSGIDEAIVSKICRGIRKPTAEQRKVLIIMLKLKRGDL